MYYSSSYLEDMLARAMEALEAGTPFDKVLSANPRLAKWHSETAKRREQERKQKEKQAKARAAASAKRAEVAQAKAEAATYLTPEELELFGLRKDGRKKSAYEY